MVSMSLDWGRILRYICYKSMGKGVIGVERNAGKRTSWSLTVYCSLGPVAFTL